MRLLMAKQQCDALESALDERPLVAVQGAVRLVVLDDLDQLITPPVVRWCGKRVGLEKASAIAPETSRNQQKPAEPTTTTTTTTSNNNKQQTTHGGQPE